MRYTARAPLRIDFAGAWTDDPEFAEDEGGAALTASITRFAQGSIAWPSGDGPLRALRSDRSYLSLSVDVPPGAGLGDWSAQNVLWAALVRSVIENTSDRADIAGMAWTIGKSLGILEGKLDTYASALGGFNYLTFTDHVTVERLSLDPPVVDALRGRLLLVYSGESRRASQVDDLIWQRNREGESGVRSSLQALRRLAAEMRDAVLASDLEALGSLINETWQQQKGLHPAINTPEIDALIARGRAAGALAGKACGRGGGGCVLLLARDGETARVRASVETRRTPIIEFDFDTYGVHLRKA